MTSFLPTLFAAVLLAAPAPAPEEKPKPPQNSAPEFTTVSATDQKEGTCNLFQLKIRAVVEERTIKRAVNGKVVIEKVMVTKYITEKVEFAVKLKGSKITDGEGNAVTEDDAWKRLTPDTTIVLSRHGGKVDPAYLRLFKKDTLVITLPAPDDGPSSDSGAEHAK